MYKTAIITGLVLAFSSVGIENARAALIAYSIQGTTNSGSLSGQSYSGLAVFNTAGITGTGNESVPLTSIDFTFLGNTFALADANATPTANYFDGAFIGIDYAVTVTDAFFQVSDFSLTTGFDVTDAAFAYTPRIGTAGSGSLTFTSTSVPAVPEPSTVLGLLVAGGVISLVRKHR